MVEATRIYVRYDIEDDNGSTRREKNERANRLAPPFEVPSNGMYLWEWFKDLNSSISRISEGVCRLIPPSEIKAWSELTGNFIHPFEYDILNSMDIEFCNETNLEFKALRERQKEEHERRMAESKRGVK